MGSDHAGFELKSALLRHLEGLGHEGVDCGPSAYDPEDDYPPYVLRAAAGAVAEAGALGVVIGGSGNGEAIAANKVRGVRCALAFSDETARLGREHNNANVVSLGARMYPTQDALRFAEIFLATDFSAETRHERRIAELDAYERSGELPPLPAS